MPEDPDIEIFKRYVDATWLHQKRYTRSRCADEKILRRHLRPQAAEILPLKGRSFSPPGATARTCS